MRLKKDGLILILPIIEIFFAGFLMYYAIENNIFLYFIISSFFSWQCGWGLKSIKETFKLRNEYINLENSKFIEHWKVFYLFGFSIVSLVVGFVAFIFNSYFLGFFALLFGFFAGTSFRITIE